MSKMTIFYYIDGDKLRTVWTDNPREVDLVRVRFGEVFFNRAEAVKVLFAPKTEKVRVLTDEERRQLELEQIAYGRSLMTEEEKAEARERNKSIDQRQLEFARMMQQTEKEWCRC